MSASKIEDEIGGGKKNIVSWPIGDHKLNYLMFAANFTATATTYIINGKASDEALKAYFQKETGRAPSSEA